MGYGRFKYENPPPSKARAVVVVANISNSRKLSPPGPGRRRAGMDSVDNNT
jgi:hypothetical protein